MRTFDSMIHEAASFLEASYTCKKHHVQHTGSTAYLLDLYDFLGEAEKGKKLVWNLIGRIVESPDGGKVFYPGHLNPMNMSQNVIDTGTAVDAIARFAHRRKNSFSEEEHQKIKSALKEVVETYLAEASTTKKITNQRLWGLTGVASYAKYAGEESNYQNIAKASIEKAFNDMTVDGFFRYFPDPPEHSLPYDAMTTFYQSRHTAFLMYSTHALGLDVSEYEENIKKSINALLSMYDSKGIKDLRMECKRWYWLGSYEVASHPFDAFTLSQSSQPTARLALHNVLYQIKKHFYGGFMHSHKGTNLDFQCPIFWTAHLAWLTRIPEVEKLFDQAKEIKPFSFSYHGKEIFTKTEGKVRVLINMLWQPRNLTTGIIENGLPDHSSFRVKFPKLPHAVLFSWRELLNHSWYALRGGHFVEAMYRLWILFFESFFMFLPYYSTSYGKINSIQLNEDGRVVVSVTPATKYGSLAKELKEVVLDI